LRPVSHLCAALPASAQPIGSVGYYQWEISAGGNDHWYGSSFQQASIYYHLSNAPLGGANVASIGSAAEES